MSYIRNLRKQIGKELILVPSVAAVIRDDAGRLLLQRKSEDGSWSLPAGAIEPGESPSKAVVREVLEETGLDVNATVLLGVFGGAPDFRFVYPNGDPVEYLVALFRCIIVSDSHSPSDKETSVLKYFDQKEMPQLALPYPFELLFDDLDSKSRFN